MLNASPVNSYMSGRRKGVRGIRKIRGLGVVMPALFDYSSFRNVETHGLPLEHGLLKVVIYFCLLFHPGSFTVCLVNLREPISMSWWSSGSPERNPGSKELKYLAKAHGELGLLPMCTWMTLDVDLPTPGEPSSDYRPGSNLFATSWKTLGPELSS